MSLVGTRPPTVDEWEQYELHHRSRMSTKPGITGMWQVSGRSDITDFEEVVRLDTEYIQNVEPDISVICDSNKLDDSGCKGAPDWVIEIVSPASKQMDYYTKLFKYRTAGIREYWIVDPSKNLVVVYNFELGETEQYTLQDSIKVGIYDELVIDFGSIEL